MKAPLHIIPQKTSHDLVEVLRGLLQLASEGELTGLVIGCAFKEQRYFFDAAGTLHRNPMMGIAAASQLTYELNSRVRRSDVETIF